MKQVYHLKWVDTLVTEKLNPHKFDLSSISEDEMEEISSQIPIKIDKAKSRIFKQIFSLKEEGHVKLLINMYKDAARFLLDAARENEKAESFPSENEALTDIYSKLITCLQKLLSFIQDRFPVQIRTNESLKHENSIGKVTCTLSADQIAIFIRAATDLEIFTGKSLSEVFKVLIPHLSTPVKDDLSWENARRKAYASETRDQNVLVKKLKLIIEKIEEY